MKLTSDVTNSKTSIVALGCLSRIKRLLPLISLQGPGEWLTTNLKCPVKNLEIKYRTQSAFSPFAKILQDKNTLQHSQHEGSYSGVCKE